MLRLHHLVKSSLLSFRGYRLLVLADPSIAAVIEVAAAVVRLVVPPEFVFTVVAVAPVKFMFPADVAIKSPSFEEAASVTAPAAFIVTSSTVAPVTVRGCVRRRGCSGVYCNRCELLMPLRQLRYQNGFRRLC